MLKDKMFYTIKICLVMVVSIFSIGCSNKESSQLENTPTTGNASASTNAEIKEEVNAPVETTKVPQSEDIKEEVKEEAKQELTKEDLEAITGTIELVTPGGFYADREYTIVFSGSDILLSYTIPKKEFMEHYDKTEDKIQDFFNKGLTFDDINSIMKDEISTEYDALVVELQESNEESYAIKRIE